MGFIFDRVQFKLSFYPEHVKIPAGSFRPGRYRIRYTSRCQCLYIFTFSEEHQEEDMIIRITPKIQQRERIEVYATASI